MTTRAALVRPLSPSFEKAIQITKVPLNFEIAEEQHEAYTRLVSSLVPTTVIPASTEHPDCNFIEDTAVMLSPELAVGSSFAVSSRQGEQGPVHEALKALGVWVLELPKGATMDGGDILQVGSYLLVGQGSRTNAGALEALKECAEPLGYRVLGLAVPAGVVHLKSVVSKASEALVVVHAECADLAAAVAGTGLAVQTVPDFAAANVLRLNQTLVVPAGFPRSLALLTAAVGPSVTVVELETSELRKADGALTCGSILLPATR